MLAHKAVHEVHVAVEVSAGELQGNKYLAAAAYNASVIPSMSYTDSEVAWVGLNEDPARALGSKVKKGLFPRTASGRAIAKGRDQGVAIRCAAFDRNTGAPQRPRVSLRLKRPRMATARMCRRRRREALSSRKCY
jgi:pyruvate/2-oxoglutarate dehydrogenase complex dihydrolipoamide dehydrogenase (E3) component